jgi:hypothetical protein
MIKNMSFPDRLLRVLIALTWIVLYVNNVVAGTVGVVLIAISVVFLATSFINYCPLYSALGIKKWERKSPSKE